MLPSVILFCCPSRASADHQGFVSDFQQFTAILYWLDLTWPLMLIGAVWTAARLKTTVPWRGPCMTDRLQIPHRVTKKPGRQTYVHEHTHTHRESWSLRSHLARQADGTDFEWSLPQILTAPRGNKPTPPGVHCTNSPGSYAFSLLLLRVISQYSNFARLVPSLNNCDGMSCYCLLHSDRSSMKKYDWINLLSTRIGEKRGLR